jgi:hypothetical protein
MYTNSPYRVIPSELHNDYTMNGKIPVFDWYLDGSKKNGVIWNNDTINDYINRLTPQNIANNCEGISGYDHNTCVNLLKAFNLYHLHNKKIAVVGSETPWIEAILINLHNTVTTIEYNVPECNFDKLECKDYFTFFENNSDTFDAIVTYSSIEHSGLGRYGDPLDPFGDIKTMKVIHNNLKKDGILVWGAPVGKDALSWNAHRVYGELRLPLLFENFQELEWINTSKQTCLSIPLANNAYNPVVVLKKMLISEGC